MPQADTTRGNAGKSTRSAKRRARRQSAPFKPAPPPTPVQRARAQERYYESQGRAVEKQANRQRRDAERPPAPRPPVFRPFGKHGRSDPLERGSWQYRTRRAMPDHPAIPTLPVPSVPRARPSLPLFSRSDAAQRTGALTPTSFNEEWSEYDTDQRRAILELYRHAMRKAGVDSITELYNLGSIRQRRNMRAVGRAVNRSIAPRNISEADDISEDVRRVDQTPGRVKIAGVDVDVRIPGTDRNIAGVARDVARITSPLPLPGTVLGEVTRATAEDPAAVAKTTVRTGVESIAGIPQGVKAIIDDPGGALEAIAKDYEQRYGPIFNDPAKFREAVKSEYGLTPYALDALTAAAGAGRGLGAAGRVGAVQRAAAALADTGAPGGRAVERVLTATSRERPNLRYSGGEQGVRRQRTSSNVFKAVGQHALDERRRRAFARRAKREGLDVRDGRLVERDGGAGRLPAVRPGAGEVVPAASLRDSRALRKFTGRIERDIGGAQSVTRVRMLARQARSHSEIRRALRKLNPDEQAALKYLVQLGVRPDASGLRALRTRLEQIRRARDEQGVDVAPVLRDTNDEILLIERILAKPDSYLTPRAREAADELIKVQRREEAEDPGLDPDQAAIRAATPQGRLLNVKRGPDAAYFRRVLADIEQRTGAPGAAARADELADLPPGERPARAAELRAEARAERKAAERAVEQAGQREAVELERLGVREQFGPGEVAGYRVTHGERRNRFDTREEAEAYAESIGGVPSDVREIRRLDRRAGLFNGGQLEQARLRAERAQIEAASTRAQLDRAKRTEKAMRKVLKAAGSRKHARLEGAAEFTARVRAAAEEAGLAEPAYWHSTPYAPGEGAAGLATTGRGFTATGRTKRYQGRVFDVGAEAHTVDVFTAGIERNIKRRFQWALVQQNLDKHAFEWSRGKQGEGITVRQARELIDQRRIDPASVELIPTNYVHPHLTDQAGATRGRVLTDEELDALDIPDDPAAARPAFDQERTTLEQAERMAAESKSMARGRYLVVPREVAYTIAQRLGDGQVMRGLEIVLKNKPTRIMLGALNVPWLAFQVASNAFLTGLGGGVHPLNVYGAMKFFRGLDPDEREALEAELGITHGHHHAGLEQANLGQTNNRLVHTWRAFKKTRAMRLGHRVNPLNLMFRADEAQNNFFRKVLFYDAARKQAYRRMGRSWRGIDRSISRVVDRVLAQPPHRQAELIARHGNDFGEVAEHVNAFLGDYLRFSPAERHLLSRNVMFYGYVRFSLRFAFYTMPVQHPIMATILGRIGELGSDEIHELFGLPRTTGIGPSAAAQLYFGRPGGQLEAVNLGRMNPALNALTQMERPSQFMGLVSPIYQAVADQMFEESSFTGRDWRVRGETTPPDDGEYGGRARTRIFGRSLLRLGYPYRVAEQMTLEPSQSDDALLWSPRPIEWSPRGDAYRPVQRERRQWRRKGPLERAGATVNPFLPEPSILPQLAREEAERRDGKAKRRRRQRPRADRYGGSSTGGRYGTGSTSSRYGG